MAVITNHFFIWLSDLITLKIKFPVSPDYGALIISMCLPPDSSRDHMSTKPCVLEPSLLPILHGPSVKLGSILSSTMI